MAQTSRRTLSQTLRLEAGEFGPVAALTAHSFGVVGSFLVGRSARDALFLERAPARWLPWMYLLSAVAVALVGFGYGRVSESFRRDRIAAVSAFSLGAAILLLWALLALHLGGIETVLALYLVVEVSGALAILQLWMLANDVFDSRQARRIFPIIGVGGTLANIVCGGAATALASKLGTGSLLIFCALLLLGVGWLAMTEGRLLLRPGASPALLRTNLALKARRPGFERIGSRDGQHLLSIAKLIAVTFLTTTLIDYQFKLSARAAFTGPSLAAFFGGFYALTGVLGLGTQLLGTRRVLDRLGLLGALAFLPLGLSLGS